MELKKINTLKALYLKESEKESMSPPPGNNLVPILFMFWTEIASGFYAVWLGWKHTWHYG